MTDRVHHHPNLIFSVGTQVVTLVDIPGSAGLVLHPRVTREGSALPEAPRGSAALHDLLVRLRLSERCTG